MKKKSIPYFLALIFWRIFKPKTFGARALLIKNDQVLLVRHTYQSLWYLPGGGVKSGETYGEALQRELKEEIDVTVCRFELFGLYNSTFEVKNDSIAIFLCTEFELGNQVDRIEIAEMRFFKLKDLPADISPGTYRRIQEYINNAYPNFGRW